MLQKVFNPRVRQLIYALSGVFHVFAITYFSITEENWAIITTGALGAFDAVLAFLNVTGPNQPVIAGKHEV